MPYALGTCRHNNLTGSCPSCISAAEGTMGHYVAMGDVPEGRMYSCQMGKRVSRRSMRGMGDCQPGYSTVLGVCVPGISTDLSLAQSSVSTAIATGVATTPSVQAAAANAAQQTVAQKIVAFVDTNPLGALGIAAAIFIGIKLI